MKVDCFSRNSKTLDRQWAQTPGPRMSTPACSMKLIALHLRHWNAAFRSNGLTEVDRTMIPSMHSNRPMFSDPIRRRECFSGSFLHLMRSFFMISAYSGSSILSCAQPLRSRYSRYSSGLSRMERASSGSYAIRSSKSTTSEREPDRATWPRRFLYLYSSSAVKERRKSWKRSSGF